MNGHNNDYIVLFGRDRYSPDAHYRAARKFDTIKEAREYAAPYENAYIFRVHHAKDSGDITDINNVL